jgi:O-antigen/teichoic acid export membrane protein
MRRNAALLLAARVVSAGTTLVVLAIVARLRGPEALGAVGLGFAIGAIAATVSDVGTSSLLVREGARREAAGAEILGAGLVTRLASIPLVLGIVLLVASLIAPGQVPVVVTVAVGLVLQQTAELTRSVFNARQRMTVSASHAIVENLLWLVVVAAGLLAGADLGRTFLAAAAVMGVSALVGLGLDRWVGHVRPRLPAPGRRRPLAAMAAPFATFSMLGMAYTRLDTVIIAALMTGPALVVAGAYFAATRLIGAFEYLPEAVGRATYPELSRRVVDDPPAARPLLRQATTTLLVIGAGLPPVLVTAGPWIMTTLFAEIGPEAGLILAGLSLALPWRFVGYLLGTALTSADAMGRRVAAASITLVVVLVVDTVGILLVGIVAPVIGAILAAIILVVLYGRFVRERFGPLGLQPRILVATVVAAVVATGIGLALRTVVPEPLAAGVAGAAYLVAIAVVPGWPVVLGQRASPVPTR